MYGAVLILTSAMWRAAQHEADVVRAAGLPRPNLRHTYAFICHSPIDIPQPKIIVGRSASIDLATHQHMPLYHARMARREGDLDALNNYGKPWLTASSPFIDFDYPATDVEVNEDGFYVSQAGVRCVVELDSVKAWAAEKTRIKAAQ
ncbi:hypothetical protein B0A48_17799 [Cryoendolithus antarcticus]|uniref:Uncharacterized protein n=1 Tax=Cryoendolithus antarcticus TaxID=1507870 RepID=A0A1V8SB39_9PEZI|nr:hypothetical protein B0A48_17799 [Cryoendolithus antarcticus]